MAFLILSQVLFVPSPVKDWLTSTTPIRDKAVKTPLPDLTYPEIRRYVRRFTAKKARIRSPEATECTSTKELQLVLVLPFIAILNLSVN